MPGPGIQSDLRISEYMTPWDIYLHGVTRILASSRTRFQDMQIIETGAYGTALVLDGKWQSSTVDEFLYHEPLVHTPCVLHGSPERALVLGGAEGATLRELFRWNTIKHVTMVDIDDQVVDACRTHLAEMHCGSFEDPRLQLVTGDALEFLENATDEWDVIISDLSDPIENGPSFKLFTQEFFRLARTRIRPGGLFVMQAGSVAPPSIPLHARLRRTVDTIFAHNASILVNVPTFGEPCALIVAGEEPIDTLPDPGRIDRLLRERDVTGLRMFDGRSLLGSMQLPLHLRDAIARQTRVYTLANPPGVTQHHATP